MPAADIEDVLSATNHYEVLGVDPADAADLSLLRRAYLKRSVRVHPDKNGDDPRATQAFQKVTHAYNVLSEDDTRARYERYGDEAETDSNGETQYARGTADPSFQDAMFVFASVASMMGGARAGSVADFAQAMYFAESLFNNEKGIDLSDGKAKAQAAMAGGASLRVVANSMRAMGFKKTAAATDSAASIVQVAGLGAMVADTPMVKKALEDPAVKRTLDAGGQKLSQLKGSISAAMNSATQEQTQQQKQRSAGVDDSQASMGDSVKKAFGSFSTAARDAMKNRSEASSSTASRAAPTQAQPQTGNDNSFASSAMGMGAMFSAAAASMGSSSGTNGQASSRGSTNNNFNNNNPNDPDNFDDTVKKAKAAGAAAGGLKKAGETAKRMGLNKQAADLENAANVAEMAGKAAKVADHPMVQSAMQQPAVKRAVEAGAQQLFKEVMKSTKA